MSIPVALAVTESGSDTAALAFTVRHYPYQTLVIPAENRTYIASRQGSEMSSFNVDPYFGLQKAEKDEAASLVYAIDVAATLDDGEVVNGVTVSADGVTAGTPIFTDSVLSVRISGGVNGSVGTCTFTWTTSGGDTDRRRLIFDVRAR